MGDIKRPGARAVALGLMAGSAAWVALAGAATAQNAGELPLRVPGSPTPLLPFETHRVVTHTPAIATPTAAEDGLGKTGFYLEADTVVRDDAANVWTARGGVEARYKGRTLRADEVVYDVATGAVTARGHVQVIEDNGAAVSADHMVLDDHMRAGFALGFSAHGPDNTTFASSVAIRRSASVTELDRAIFTPCDICAANGSSITPSWSIQASKVIQDHEHHLVFYRNAVISIKGVPVLYAPVFWTPDPDSKRLSGLLMPLLASTSSRGLSYEQPYLQVISPSQELVVSPQINTSQNPFLNLKWLERFYSGDLQARVGYTYSQDFDSHGSRFGPETSRSYILADGHFDINDDWSWGFALDRASDPLIFEKYDIRSVFSDQGLYVTDTQRLLSQIFAVRQDSNSYLSIAALDFQGLRTNPAGATENSATFPIVAPLIEARYEPNLEILGGRMRFLGSAVVLSTPDSAIDPSKPGLDDRRATAEADWQTNVTFDNGLRLSPFLDARTDIYNVQNLSPTNTADRSIERGLGTAGLNVSWPFIKQAGDTTIVLEPMAQLDLSPNVSLNPNIPNTDSVVTAFDETNLFSMDRFSGFDLYEGGQRANLGGRATVDWGDGYSARLLVGRTFRAQAQSGFPRNTGLNGQSSDWVVAGDTTPLDGLSLFGRTLLTDALQSELTEVGIDYANSRSRGYLRYDDDNTQITGRTRDIEGAEDFFVTKHWGVTLVGVRDIELNKWRKTDTGLIYQDDCIRAEVVYQQEDTVVGRLGKSDAVLFNLKIATLGGEGYTDADSR